MSIVPRVTSRDYVSGPGNPTYTHGRKPKHCYSVWNAMRQRCTNPKNTRYHCYGGRGITVCPEWNDFVTFRDWSLANGYDDNLQIDRIDNNGNYEPSNCRWTTQRINVNNKNNNRILTAFGETKTMSYWIDDPRCVVPYSCLEYRLYILGWDAEKAMSTPSAKQPTRTLTAFGETKSFSAWIQDPRCSLTHHHTLRTRIDYGYDPERAITMPLIESNAKSMHRRGQH